MTDVLLVAVDQALVDRVAALGGHRVVSIDRNTVPGKHAGRSTETDFQPEVIFVGSGVSTERAIEYARVIIGDYPGISVILVAQPNRELIGQAEEAGIHRVISEGIKDRDLSRLLRRARKFSKAKPRTIPPGASSERPALDDLHPQAVDIPKQPPVKVDTPKPQPAAEIPKPEPVKVDVQPSPVAPEGPKPHQVIVVASPKGGVGKTTTAVNLAALLAESAPGEVVVIDLDLQFGDVATVLNLSPSYTISDAFASGADDSMRLRTLLVPHEANFHVLCGSENPAENGRVTGDQMRKLVHHYSAAFRYVIIDTPAGLHEETLASLEEATDIVLVAALDVATLRDMRREVDLLAELSLLPPRHHVVLNRADRRSGLTERDVERIVGLPVDVVLPVSERVVLAANRGELVSAARRRNPIRRPFKDLARIVADLTSKNGALV
jgi:pilus assembly protein CpaE